MKLNPSATPQMKLALGFLTGKIYNLIHFMSFLGT